MPSPCFPIYHLFAEADGRRPVLVREATDRTTMAIDVDTYITAISDDTRIVFVTNPHSPSGTWLEEPEVRRIIEAAPHALVVLDEAYVHYSGKSGYFHLANDYEHVAVLRTFSKAFGLAGLRIGFGLAARPIIDRLMAVKPHLEPRPTPDRWWGRSAQRRRACGSHGRHCQRGQRLLAATLQGNRQIPLRSK